MAKAVLKFLRDGAFLAIVGDSEFLVNCCLGRSRTMHADLTRPVKIAHEALRQLVQGFSARPFQHRDLVIHTPRGDNSAADAAAKRALDEGNFETCCPESIRSFCEYFLQRGAENRAGFVFSFDGASRGNPGDASHGNCAWWGLWTGGSFERKGLL